MPTLRGVKYIFFDLMGTCLDWHSSILTALPTSLPDSEKSTLALDWRQGFFDEIHARFEAGLPQEDIDVTHRCVLDQLLEDKYSQIMMNEDERTAAVESWHSMPAWPDVILTLLLLRKRGYEVFVLANGTTRLQLDLARSSELQFNFLFSSELLGLTKPHLAIYRKAMSLVGADLSNSLMVAAHAYDLRAAKEVGMRTVYVRRWSEDRGEDMEVVKIENDGFVGTFEGLVGLLGVEL